MVKSGVNHILDLRGSFQPITLLKITQAFRDMRPDDILEILGRDADTKKNLFKVLQSFSFDLILMEETDAAYRIQLKKR